VLAGQVAPRGVPLRPMPAAAVNGAAQQLPEGSGQRPWSPALHTRFLYAVIKLVRHHTCLSR
jgi:hypothetical protein